MDNTKYFDDEDENIFSDEDISYDTSSKAPRPIPTWLMTEFWAWLDRFHPEIQMVSKLSRFELDQLIHDFEAFAGRQYGYTVRDWQHNLRGR